MQMIKMPLWVQTVDSICDWVTLAVFYNTVLISAPLILYSLVTAQRKSADSDVYKLFSVQNLLFQVFPFTIFAYLVPWWSLELMPRNTEQGWSAVSHWTHIRVVVTDLSTFILASLLLFRTVSWVQDNSSWMFKSWIWNRSAVTLVDLWCVIKLVATTHTKFIQSLSNPQMWAAVLLQC